MSLFPFFKDIQGSCALIIGGGEVALRRAAILCSFGAEVTCVAPEFRKGFETIPAKLIQRRFAPEDLSGCDILVAASDDRSANALGVELALAQGCEVCVGDDAEAGTFQFPAIVRRGGITAAISSGGESPVAVKYIRGQIETAIPENFEAVLETMHSARARVRELIPVQKERARVLRTVFDECLNAAVQPDEQALEGMICRILSTEVD